MRATHVTTILTALWLGAAAGAAAQPAGAPAGHWEGVIHMGAQEVPVAIDLARAAEAGWIGSMRIPGPNPVEVPVKDISADGPRVRFQAGLPDNPIFDATLSADASHLSGEASNQHGAVPFELVRKGDAHVKVPPKSSALATSFEGTWEGVADLGGTPSRVVLKMRPAADGTAVATLTTGDRADRPGQDIPVTTVTIRDRQLELDVPGAPGSYRGALGPTGEIAGQWIEGTVTIALNFKRVSAEAK